MYSCFIHDIVITDYLAVSSEQWIHIILLLLYGRRSTCGIRKYSKVYPHVHMHMYTVLLSSAANLRRVEVNNKRIQFKTKKHITDHVAVMQYGI